MRGQDRLQQMGPQEALPSLVQHVRTRVGEVLLAPRYLQEQMHLQNVRCDTGRSAFFFRSRRRNNALQTKRMQAAPSVCDAAERNCMKKERANIHRYVPAVQLLETQQLTSPISPVSLPHCPLLTMVFNSILLVAVSLCVSTCAECMCPVLVYLY